jgi:hypothetical protein
LKTLLPDRFPKTRFLKPLLKFLDTSVNLLLNFTKLFNNPLHIQSQFISDKKLNKDFQDFIHTFYKKNNYVERFSEHFDWILNFPWVLQGKQDEESKRYYFSSKAKQFEYEAIKFYKDNKLSAFMLLKVRDGKLSVSYVFANDDLIEDIANCIMKKVYDEMLSIISVYDERIADGIRKHKAHYLFERSCKHPYILPKKMNLTPDTFQVGDGDNIFT